VVNRGRSSGFPAEPLAERLVVGKPGRKDLQCDVPPEPLIVGTVDNGHTPSAEDLVDPVPGYALPLAKVAERRRLVAHHASPLSPAAERPVLVLLSACLTMYAYSDLLPAPRTCLAAVTFMVGPEASLSFPFAPRVW
jgi:hypothetical protein